MYADLLTDVPNIYIICSYCVTIMDVQSYSRMLSYVACELTMPVKKHLYNFALNDHSSLKHHLLTAAISAASSQRIRNLVPHAVNERKTQSKVNIYKDSTLPKEQVYNVSDHGKTVLEEELLIDKLHVEKSTKSKSSPISECEILEEGTNKNTSLAGCNRQETMTDVQGTGTEIQLEKSLCNPAKTEEIEDRQIETILDNPKTNINILQESEIFSADIESFDEETELFSDPLLLCSESDFKMMFRMTRITFQKLLEFLSKEDMEPIENVPLYKKVLIVLWLMGNSGSYSDAAQVFSVTEEAAANCFFDVCATLYNKSDVVIRWPSSEECNETASRIEKKYGFPGVVGILGCHYFSISIPKDALSRREHFNAKYRTYCLALQIVCDDRLVIRDIFPGLPGGIPEAQVLRESLLCKQLTSKTEPHQLVEPQKHILARSEYPQLTCMLTPYIKAPETLSKDELEFNVLHEHVCQLVDQTFQMLQDRFLTLKLLDPEVATMVLVAACVLHNICLENCDMFHSVD